MKKLDNIKTIADDIKTITIQWATNIAVAAFSIMKLELNTLEFKSIEELNGFVRQWAKMLMEARNTEPMLFNGMKYVLSKLPHTIPKTPHLSSPWRRRKSNVKLVSENLDDVKKLQKELAAAFDEFMWRVEAEKKIRKELWSKLIHDWDSIFTHCHSSSVVGILKQAHVDKKKIHVYNDETRPLYQWRITSKELADAWIQNTMVTDGSSTFFVDNMYENHVHIDKIIIGCDSIRINGDVLNKVWSFGIGLAAHHSKIPVYIAGSLMKVDITNMIEIEKRSANEVWEDRPKELEIMNYAFDMIPAKFITWIITEFGIIKPKDIKKMVKKYYPWMLK